MAIGGLKNKVTKVRLEDMGDGDTLALIYFEDRTVLRVAGIPCLDCAYSGKHECSAVAYERETE